MNNEKKYMMDVYRKYPVCFVKGKGMYLWDNKGKKYMDFLSGIAVNSFGYSNPRIVNAVINQTKNFIHVSNLFHIGLQTKLAKKLVDRFGEGKVFLSNSGTEANECAIKFARKWGASINKNKYEIVSSTNSFHGRSFAALSSTGQPKLHEGFYPLVSGFKYAEFNNIDSFKKNITSKTCAVMLEIIQGEGGVKMVNKKFLKELVKFCKAKNVLLILDEIQVGMGRTGKFFAYEHFNIKPDIVTLSKSLAGGLPLGATIVKDELSDVFTKGSHGSTFGGNPVACAASIAVLNMLTPKMLVHIQTMGDYFFQQLKSLKAKHKVVKEVRGYGLILALELKVEGREIVEECLKNGFIINVTQNNVLRFLPPFIITKQNIDSLIKKLDEILAKFY